MKHKLQPIVALASGALLLTGQLHDERLSVSQAFAGDESKLAHAPSVALITGAPRDTRSSVLLAIPGHEPTTVALFEHPLGSVVRGAVMPGTSTILVLSDINDSRERSWAAGLMRVDPGQPVRRLADRVYHASRPLPVDSKYVLVQRGRAGIEPTGNEPVQHLRVDDLSVDEVNVDSGAVRTIHAWAGYETHLAGISGREVILYRVGTSGADLVGIDLDTLAVRTIIGSWPAAARDFSVDPSGRGLILQQLAADGQWAVERVDLLTGDRKPIATSRSTDMSPFSWPNGSVYLQPEGSDAPTLIGAGRIAIGAGDGVVWPRATDATGEWVAALRMPRGALPTAMVVRTSDGVAFPLRTPANERVEVAGFVGGTP